MMLLITVILISAASAAGPVEPDPDFWSIAGVAETDGEERTLYGVDFRRVIYWDDHAPPITAYYGGQYLSGDGQSIVRGTGTFSILAFPVGSHVSFWFRPMAGIEYRSDEPDSGFGVLVALGGEFILKPKPTWQVAFTADRVFSTLGTNNQFGVAIRWAINDAGVKPNNSVNAAAGGRRPPRVRVGHSPAARYAGRWAGYG